MRCGELSAPFGRSSGWLFLMCMNRLGGVCGEDCYGLVCSRF